MRSENTHGRRRELEDEGRERQRGKARTYERGCILLIIMIIPRGRLRIRPETAGHDRHLHKQCILIRRPTLCSVHSGNDINNA